MKSEIAHRFSGWRPGNCLPLPLTMPAVTVKENCWPSGLPTASTHSPMRSSSESANDTVVRFSASILITATSVSRSRPTTRASNSRPSSSLTVRISAVATTWLLVMMYPSGEMMNPLPVLGRNWGVWSRNSGNMRSNGAGRSGCWRSIRSATRRSAVMNTTVGRTASATATNASPKSTTGCAACTGAGRLANVDAAGCCASERLGTSTTETNATASATATPTNAPNFIHSRLLDISTSTSSQDQRVECPVG